LGKNNLDDQSACKKKGLADKVSIGKEGKKGGGKKREAFYSPKPRTYRIWEDTKGGGQTIQDGEKHKKSVFRNKK